MCDDKSASARSATDGVISGQHALLVEEKRKEALAGERACAEAEREEYEGILEDALVRLRDGAVSGRQWREREKLLTSLVDTLSGLGVDRSLLNALPVALKTKADARGVFAKQAVTFSDDVLRKHIAVLSDNIERVTQESAKCEQAAHCAQQALAITQQVQSAALNEHVTAENTLQEAQSRMQEARALMQASKAKISKQSTILVQSCAEKVYHSELFAQFVDWRDGLQNGCTENISVAESPEEVMANGTASEAKRAEATKTADTLGDSMIGAASMLQAAEFAGA